MFWCLRSLQAHGSVKSNQGSYFIISPIPETLCPHWSPPTQHSVWCVSDATTNSLPDDTHIKTQKHGHNKTMESHRHNLWLICSQTHKMSSTVVDVSEIIHLLTVLFFLELTWLCLAAGFAKYRLQETENHAYNLKGVYKKVALRSYK